MSQPRPTAALLKLWYDKAEAAGFEDIESWDVPGEPLKRWSGVNNVIDNVSEAREPDDQFYKKTAFMYHNKFERACQEICRHGNSKLTPELAAVIWDQHCAGATLRAIGSKLGQSHHLVNECIQRMTKLMNLLGDSMEDTNVKIVLRPHRVEDDALIYSTWRNSLWYDNKRSEDQAAAFFRAASKYIKTIMDAPTTKVIIACREDDSDHIIGYAVLSTTNLEWVYVKIDYRKQGIGSMLTKGFKTVTKPRTRIGNAIAVNKGLKVLNE